MCLFFAILDLIQYLYSHGSFCQFWYLEKYHLKAISVCYWTLLHWCKVGDLLHTVYTPVWDILRWRLQNLLDLDPQFSLAKSHIDIVSPSSCPEDLQRIWVRSISPSDIIMYKSIWKINRICSVLFSQYVTILSMLIVTILFRNNL